MKTLSIIVALVSLAITCSAQTIKQPTLLTPPATIKDWKLHKHEKAMALGLKQLKLTQDSGTKILKEPLALNKYKKPELKVKKKTAATMPVIKPNASTKYHVRTVKPDTTIHYHALIRKPDLLNTWIGKTDTTTLKLSK